MQALTSIYATDSEPAVERGGAPLAIARGRWSLLQGVILERQNVGPRRLGEPGPSAAQVEQLVLAAAAAPDHGRLTPWRFVLVPSDKRGVLAEAFADAAVERDPCADDVQLAQAREKAFRGPLLMLAVTRLGREAPFIPMQERLVTLGCAIQNLLLAAHAMGYGSGLASGQALSSTALRKLFRLLPDEEAVCFVTVGTVREHRPLRDRPKLADVLKVL